MASTIYDKTSGQILQVIGTDDVPDTATTASISGTYPPPFWRIDLATGQPVAIPPYSQGIS